ncbi:Phage P2 baseplate assembly gpV-like protein [Azotobacter vinelandii CA]|uniref:Phage P2 baseplate assembly gpV-like protein n=2 Tax=Azotobacter vinelandii TaxID=354 RepID=C1DS18_AZOVD|nr:phage baseplate assembly protein V [Azotobacter vinelandii]ACO79893.1 Phage P2 baseplate assembly gpV-like protein [Azotobacter vinelandii DJ]AGK14060.1 Phage P2 baseplate assembly gpV-like protein [Azotobacter vinelandii CA]AGK18947.1 Phage P2 baseplate assembly gpV-like protein [Azotobacter vinelandii CA6]SFX44615.1 phage baseplate assembly protein V [Azotobacter vinelandii]
MAAMNTADLTRRLENLIRLGTVAEVDPDVARCRVQTGGLLTGWLPWLAERAGFDRTWNPPSTGEQCLLLSPSGDPATGIVLLGLYSTASPAPDDSLTRHRRTYRDGAVIEYDTESHTLRATLPDGGQADIVAPGGVTILGNVTITGLVTVTEDVIAAGISLVQHVHGGVMPGGATTGGPQ